MTAKENLILALVVMALGVTTYFVIPFQVDMESVPGSMGYSKVGPATLPYLASWGFLITGLIWITSEARRYLKVRRDRKAGLGQNQGAAAEDQGQNENWTWSLLLWVAAAGYVALIPALGFAESCMVFGLPLGLAMIRSRKIELRPHTLLGLLIGVILFPVLLHFLFYRFLYVAFPAGPISRWLAGG